jgi:hypothetical protein
MTDSQEQLALIGAAIDHAKRLQEQVEATRANMEAEGRALQKTAAQLLTGVDERAQALGVQEQRLAQQVSALAAQIEKLGPFAFAGGKVAVKEEVREALKDASTVAVAAARETTAPVKEALSAGAAAIGAAQDSLAQAQRRFSWRALAILGAAALGALGLAAAGGFAMIGWQRVEITNAREELVRLQDRVQEVATTVAEMEKKGRELDAKGVRFETTRCQEEKGGKTRLCVEIDPKAPDYSVDDGRRQFRVPKGF